MAYLWMFMGYAAASAAFFIVKEVQEKDEITVWLALVLCMFGWMCIPLMAWEKLMPKLPRNREGDILVYRRKKSEATR